MKQYVIGMGEVLWDVLPEGKRLGGAPANFAYHAMQQGLDGRVVSAVGRDALGDEIVAALADKGLPGGLPRVDYPTGTVTVELDGAGIPRYDIRENVAWDHIPWTEELRETARHTRAVCFGTLAQRSEESRQTVRRFLEEMPDALPDEATGELRPTLKVFDCNLRQHFYTKERLEDSMRACQLLKINDEELVVVARLLGLPVPGEADFATADALRPAVDGLMERYALQMLVLTCGTKGSYVFSPAGVSYRPTPEVRVADTVGAGDSFTATFVAALIQGVPVGEAHRRAVAVSAFVCTQSGAMPVLPLSLTGG